MAKELADLVLRQLTGTYYEPFLGGGAAFFEIAPARAVISDVNGELVNVYRNVKRRPDAIISRLKRMEVNAQVYEEVRSRNVDDSLQRAVDFLYLNRTAWGGIYRLNSLGRFNVPYGGGERKPDILWKRNLLLRAGATLKRAKIFKSDFEPMIARAGSGDVVYCDPTYTVAHDRNGFIRYNEKNFSWSDQIRLAKICREAATRGAVIFVSNAHHPSLERILHF